MIWFADIKARPGELDGRAVATLPAPGVGAITGPRASMKQLTEALKRVLGTMVIDDTGLNETYYFCY